MQRGSMGQKQLAAFTLIELLTVVVVILILAGVILGVTAYVQRRMAVSTAKAELAAIETALESYKSDWGYYPLTGPFRISRNQSCEGSNNLVLYRALCGVRNKKRYLTISGSAIRTNLYLTTINPGVQTYGIYDPWGKLWNYYNSPQSLFTNHQENSDPGNTNYYAGYTSGGQVNSATYDLFSYGPDGVTFIPGCLPGYAPVNGYAWSCEGWKYGVTNSANDDITNWKY